MSAFAYDPDNYLTSSTRQLGAWTADQFNDMPELAGVFTLEMSFPDTTRLTRETPLPLLLVHFELDDDPDLVLGFGQPGEEVYDEDAGTSLLSEATLHRLNFDVGLWASAEAGGATKRMEARQALKRLFGSVTGRTAFNEATEGLQVVSFEGGHDILDRVNDLPIWRTVGATLVIEVFGRITPEAGVQVPLSVEQEQHLTIIGSDGEPEPVKTIES